MNTNFDYWFYMGSLTREKIIKYIKYKTQQKPDKEFIKALQRQLIKNKH